MATRSFRKPAYLRLLNDYLMLIPQKVGRKPDPQTLYPDQEAVRRQNDILDALEASLQSVLSQAEADNEPREQPRVFDVKLHLVKDKKTVQEVREQLSRSTLQAMHACAHLDVRTVYAVEIAPMHKAWQEGGRQVGNVMHLWHGTKASNLLSILKSGLVIPPSNAPFCTGRMFGNGIYFSDQSTKSLQLRLRLLEWADRGPLLHVSWPDMALGRTYTPKSYGEKLPRPGYDSTFARAGISGVQNNEMIVYHTRQVNLAYLVELRTGSLTGRSSFFP